MQDDFFSKLGTCLCWGSVIFIIGSFITTYFYLSGDCPSIWP